MPADPNDRIVPLPIPERAPATVVIDGKAYASFVTPAAAQEAVTLWNASGFSTVHVGKPRLLGWPAIRGRKVEIFAR